MTTEDSAANSGTLVLKGVRKSYVGTTALDGVDLRFRPGEVHALLGGNGSGKSTCIKILAGVEAADAGSLSLGGRSYSLRDHTPEQAWNMGLRFVHQQPSTFATLSVAENLALGSGFETGRMGRIDWRAQWRTATSVMERFEIDAAPHQLVGDLPASTRTLISIARALRDQDDTNYGILVLDEPTASLPDHEVSVLLSALKRYAERGQTIVYITHRLTEVLDVADRVTVLRDGRVAGELDRSVLGRDALVDLIVGRAVAQGDVPRTSTGHRRVALHAQRLPTVRGAWIDLAVREGEILGLAGLIGAGASEALRGLAGVSGRGLVTASIAGEQSNLKSRAASLRAGVAYLPGHRSDAVFFNHSVAENLALARQSSYFRGGRMRDGAAHDDARAIMRSYRIKAPSTKAAVGTLSGGNQQKLMLARLVEIAPRVLLLDEPTHGVDVGARQELHQIIRRIASEGTAVIVASTDAEELAQLCDRCVALVAGSQAGELTGDSLTADAVNRLCYREGP